MNRDIILKASHVSYSYDDGHSWALDDLSLEIERGKKIALMGANGSGKSTFFLCCAGICKPQRGSFLTAEKRSNTTKRAF